MNISVAHFMHCSLRLCQCVWACSGSGAGVIRVYNNCKEPCQGCGDSVWWWSDGQRLQDGLTCLMKACEGGHLDVVKYVCEIGGKELVMAKRKVSCLKSCVGL